MKENSNNEYNLALIQAYNESYLALIQAYREGSITIRHFFEELGLNYDEEVRKIRKLTSGEESA